MECAILIVTISTSGGLLGTGSQQAQKSVETDALPEPVRGTVCEVFKPAALEKLSARTVQMGADRFIYHIAVTDENGAKHRFDIPESALPADMLDVIDEM